MTRFLALVFSLVFGVVGALVAQAVERPTSGTIEVVDPKAPTDPQHRPGSPAKPAAPKPATATATATPPVALSDLESARIDLLAMTRQRDQALEAVGQCQSLLAPLQARDRDARLGAQIRAMQQIVEAAHPGYVWDVERGQLVPKTAATPSPTPPKKE